MKAFVISLSTIVVIFTLAIANSIYVSYVTSTLINHAVTLRADDDSVKSFSSLWEEKQFFIRISSSHDETHRIDEVLAVLDSKSNENDPNGFCEQQALLIEYLVQIQEDEKITLDSII